MARKSCAMACVAFSGGTVRRYWGGGVAPAGERQMELAPMRSWRSASVMGERACAQSRVERVSLQGLPRRSRLLSSRHLRLQSRGGGGAGHRQGFRAALPSYSCSCSCSLSEQEQDKEGRVPRSPLPPEPTGGGGLGRKPQLLAKPVRPAGLSSQPSFP